MPNSVNGAVKSLVCPKRKLGHMQREIYSPSCLRFCSALCGVRCKGLCNNNHTDCARVVLPRSMVYCHTSFQALINSTLNWVKFEAREVETFGKGKPFSRQEKVESLISYADFQERLW